MLQFVVETSEDTGDAYCLPFSADSALQPRDGEASYCAGMAEAEGAVEFLLYDFDVESTSSWVPRYSWSRRGWCPSIGCSTVASEPSHPVQVADHR